MTLKRVFRFLLLALCLFGVDFALKWYVVHYIDYPTLIMRTPFGIDLFLQYVTNKGGAWGMLSEFYKPLLIFRIGVILALFFYLIRYKHSRSGVFSLVLVITGAIANVFDCFYYGFVVDMIHITFWERSYGIFNIADALICIGCVGLIIGSMQGKRKHAKTSS